MCHMGWHDLFCYLYQVSLSCLFMNHSQNVSGEEMEETKLWIGEWHIQVSSPQSKFGRDVSLGVTEKFLVIYVGWNHSSLLKITCKIWGEWWGTLGLCDTFCTEMNLQVRVWHALWSLQNGPIVAQMFHFRCDPKGIFVTYTSSNILLFQIKRQFHRVRLGSCLHLRKVYP